MRDCMACRWRAAVGARSAAMPKREDFSMVQCGKRMRGNRHVPRGGARSVRVCVAAFALEYPPHDLAGKAPCHQEAHLATVFTRVRGQRAEAT